MRSKCVNFFRRAVVQLFFCLFCFCVPVFLLSLYSMNQSRRQAVVLVENAYQSVLQKGMAEIESQLAQIGRYTMALAFERSEPQVMAHSLESVRGVHAQYAMVRELNREISRYSCLGTLFLYLPQEDFFLCCSAPGGQGGAEQDIQVYIDAEYIQEDLPLVHEYAWKLVFVEERTYLLQVIVNEQVVTGSYIDVEQLASSLELPDMDLGKVSFRQTDGSREDIFIENGELHILAASAYDFSLQYCFPAREIGASLSFFYQYFAVVALVLLAAFGVMLAFVHRIVARPIRLLREAMVNLGANNLNYQIEELAFSSDFQMLYQTFNQMAREIQNLKIKVYEEQLTAQKFKLNILQLQVRPHFMINTLNMVYNQLYAEEISAAQSLILCTIQYFRFMMRVTDNVILVSDEIKHIEAYVQIQRLRYRKDFQFIKDIHPFTREAMIPPLLIHQFVENSVKYAMCPGHPLIIRLETKYEEVDYDPYMKIVIRDNGSGYGEELLAALNNGRDIRKEDGSRFGIMSYLKQLQFLHKTFRYRFYDEPGACVELFLPMETDLES